MLPVLAVLAAVLAAFSCTSSSGDDDDDCDSPVEDFCDRTRECVEDESVEECASFIKTDCYPDTDYGYRSCLCDCLDNESECSALVTCELDCSDNC